MRDKAKTLKAIYHIQNEVLLALLKHFKVQIPGFFLTYPRLVRTTFDNAVKYINY